MISTSAASVSSDKVFYFDRCNLVDFVISVYTLLKAAYTRVIIYGIFCKSCALSIMVWRASCLDL